MADLYLDTYSDTWREASHREPSAPSAEDEFFATETPEVFPDWQELMLAVETLTERQRFVVQLRYGLRDGYRYTQDEIASLMGITQQAVNDTERAAMESLRFMLQGSLLGDT